MEKVVPFIKFFKIIFYFKKIEPGKVFLNRSKFERIRISFESIFRIQIKFAPPPYTVVGPTRQGLPLPCFGSSAARAAHRPAPTAVTPHTWPALRPGTQPAPTPPASYSLRKIHRASSTNGRPELDHVLIDTDVQIPACRHGRELLPPPIHCLIELLMSISVTRTPRSSSLSRHVRTAQQAPLAILATPVRPPLRYSSSPSPSSIFL
jgi:hypothetical protein